MNRRIFLRIGLALPILAVTGCATGPKLTEVQSKIPPIPTGRGRIWFYRSTSFGAAIQPSVHLNGEKVGEAVPHGVYYRDVSPGDYNVLLSTEVDRRLTFTVANGEERFVRLVVTFGLIAARVYPELVGAAEARAEIASLAFTGGS
jgi:Protein of unknown function (DUF2846)